MFESHYISVDHDAHQPLPPSTFVATACFQDLYRFNHVNVDHLTETYNMFFYQTYLAKWPGLFIAAQAPNQDISGYSTLSSFSCW